VPTAREGPRHALDKTRSTGREQPVAALAAASSRDIPPSMRGFVAPTDDEVAAGCA
jgi:hypothetical protein